MTTKRTSNNNYNSKYGGPSTTPFDYAQGSVGMTEFLGGKRRWCRQTAGSSTSLRMTDFI